MASPEKRKKIVRPNFDFDKIPLLAPFLNALYSGSCFFIRDIYPPDAIQVRHGLLRPWRLLCGHHATARCCEEIAEEHLTRLAVLDIVFFEVAHTQNCAPRFMDVVIV